MKTNILLCLIVIFIYNINSFAKAKIGNTPMGLVCNEATPWVNTTFTNLTSSISDNVGGLLSICVGNVDNISNLVDADLTNFSTVKITGIGCNATLSVKDNDALDVYPAGTYAGYMVSSAGLLQGSIGSTVTIRTYNNGTLAETYNAVTATIGINSSLVDSNGNVTLGFVTKMPFNEITIQYQSLIGLLFTAQVYNAIVEEFCPGSLSCNSPSSLISPAFPVLIDNQLTGKSGLACVLCNINNVENVINDNPNDYASIILNASVGTTAAIAVVDQLSTFHAGTFVGFEIANTNILDASILNNLTIETYLNGVLQESKTSTSQLSSANTGLLSSDGKRTIGFITTLPFNEIRIVENELVNVNPLGETKVYRAIEEELCPSNLACDQTYFLSNPQFSVFVDGALSGEQGLVCASCSLNNWPAGISTSQTDYTQASVVAGLASSLRYAVVDGINTFPAGSTAGFVIDDVNNLLQLDLFNSLSICTWLDGVQQECKSGDDLINLSLLSSWGDSGQYNVGFQTSLPYDEISISIGSLASVLNVINIYSAFVDTRGATGSGFDCCPTNAVNVSQTTISNVCQDKTVDISGLASSTCPNGTVLEWHTTITPTLANLVSTPTAVVSGTYYPFCFNSNNKCYSPAPTSGVTVSISACPITLINTCPSTTVDLTAEVSSSISAPSGTILTWHTDYPATADNLVADPTVVGAGNYFASFYDTLNDCYGFVSDLVKVETVICCYAGTVAPILKLK